MSDDRLINGIVERAGLAFAFRKNEKSLSEAQLKSLADWPPPRAGHYFVHSLLRAPIKHGLEKLGRTAQILDELLPKLRMFGAVGFPGDVVIVHTETTSRRGE
jgi:hypothetical protein